MYSIGKFCFFINTNRSAPEERRTCDAGKRDGSLCWNRFVSIIFCRTRCISILFFCMWPEPYNLYYYISERCVLFYYAGTRINCLCTWVIGELSSLIALVKRKHVFVVSACQHCRSTVFFISLHVCLIFHCYNNQFIGWWFAFCELITAKGCMDSTWVYLFNIVLILISTSPLQAPSRFSIEGYQHGGKIIASAHRSSISLQVMHIERFFH